MYQGINYQVPNWWCNFPPPHTRCHAALFCPFLYPGASSAYYELLHALSGPGGFFLPTRAWQPPTTKYNKTN